MRWTSNCRPSEPMTSATGRYHDGRVATGRAVVATLEADGVAIADADGAAVAFWPAAGIRLLDRPSGGRALRLAGGAEGHERLTLDDGRALAELRRLCPALGRAPGDGRAMRRLVLPLLAAALLVTGTIVFLALPWGTRIVVTLVPWQAELRMGTALRDALITQLAAMTRRPERPGIVCADPAVDAVLAPLAARLATAGGLPVTPRVTVVALPFANAFALPGAQVLVTGQLLSEAAGPDELAGVVAHELGHVAARHGLQRLVRSAGFGIIVGLLVGDPVGIGFSAAAAHTLLEGAFSREDELAADRFAVEALNRADIEGAPLASFFDRVAARTGAAENVFALFLTHPPSAERAALIRARATGRGNAMSLEDWRRLVAACG